MDLRPVSIALACASVLPAAAQDIAPQRAPVAGYEITYNAALDADRLDVKVDISGLDVTARDVALYLEEWGRWTQFDSLYLRCVRSVPASHRNAAAGPVLTFEIPDSWDGSIHAEYQIPLIELGSALHDREGLLPWRSRGEQGRAPYVLAFANNTLPRIVVGGTIVNVSPSVTIRAPAGMKAVSGWAGVAGRDQQIKLARNIDKTPILFGAPLSVATASDAGTSFEVAQFSGSKDVTADVLAVVRALAPCYARMTGHPAKPVERVFIVDGGGGQQTDHGLLIGLSAGGEGSVSSPYFKQLVAHELFHEWLGGAAHGGGESLVWFKEGFTDYLSIRGCAMAGTVTWDWFASRLLELDGAARTGAACGRVAFGDEGVNWRDGDGPNESLAYKGGAVLALCADVELLARGRPGLPVMIGDLARRNGGEYDAEAIRAWMTSHELKDFYEAYIDAPALPDAGAALIRAGFEAQERSPATLTYFGIATDGGSVLGPVIAVDPDGPGAAAGIRVGDVINGLYPVLPEGDRPRIGAGVSTPYRFGLNLGVPGAGSITVGIERDGLQLPVRARAIDGGEFMRLSAGPTVGEFFGATGAE